MVLSRGVFFNPECTRHSLSARLCPDPLESSQFSFRSSRWIWRRDHRAGKEHKMTARKWVEEWEEGRKSEEWDKVP